MAKKSQAQAAEEVSNAENTAPQEGQENQAPAPTQNPDEQTPQERLAELEALVAEKEAQAQAAEERAKQAEAQAAAALQQLEALNNKSVAYRVSHRNFKRQHMFEMNRSPIVLRNGDPVDPEVAQFIHDNDIAIELESI